jgi:hypothetical protein
MAHFAELNDSNIVTRVVVVSNNELLDGGEEGEAKGIAFLQSLYGHRRWKQTSYNGNMRKNFASIGYAYDPAMDAFIAPRPFGSWSLDIASCKWKPPVAYPSDGGVYRWHEPSLSWLPME